MRLTQEEADIINERRGVQLSNVNNNTALDRHLDERGIDKADVISVKHWQYASGEYRFSIVTKEDGLKASIIEDTFERILEDMRDYAPVIKPIKRDVMADPHCLVFDPADIHIGKYATEYETGSTYDIDKSVKQVEIGLDGIIAKTIGFNIDKVFFVIGNDVLHTEAAYGTTKNGTRQDMSGMWYESFLAAKAMYVRSIEKLLGVADVHVIFNPSNHDYATGWMLAQTLEAYFRNSVNVTFDVSIAHRKYTSYGVNLIATSHGDGAKMESMPLLMAQESPDLWVRCPMRYVYLHHIHHKQTYRFLSGKDFVGVTVEYLRTPSASDGWHNRSGYVGAKKAVEAFIHSKQHGQVARITHNLK